MITACRVDAHHTSVKNPSKLVLPGSLTWTLESFAYMTLPGMHASKLKLPGRLASGVRICS
jgi:hypothetical protein